MYLFFDTETTGKPKRYDAPAKDVDNWPRITQLAFAVFDATGKKIHQFACLIKPDGWEIPKEKFFLDNNMTTERCEAEGLPIKYTIEEIIMHIENNPYLIAHNITFDRMVLAAEMIRMGLTTTNKPKQICTMNESTAYCKLPGSRGYKWPKLEELHSHLFESKFDGAHNALNDVEACAKCFFELVNRKVITP